MPVPATRRGAAMTAAPAPGALLARGVCRHLGAHGFACLEEFAPTRGLRVDVIALGPKGEIWIVECKSSRADFTADRKWPAYLPWCDRFFFAVDPGFPAEILPEGSGLILADSHDGEIAAMAPGRRLAGARRAALTRRLAHCAMRRLMTCRGEGARPEVPR